MAVAPRVADAAVTRAASGVRVRVGADTLPVTDGARAANQAGVIFDLEQGAACKWQCFPCREGSSG